MKTLEDRQDTTDTGVKQQHAVLQEIQKHITGFSLAPLPEQLTTNTPPDTTKVEMSIVIPVLKKWEQRRYSHSGETFVPLLDILKDLDFDRSVFEIIIVMDPSVASFPKKV